MHNLSDLQLISFPQFDSKESVIIIYEGKKKVPFNINRVFVIKSMEQSTRGNHAHKECSQILVALNGECKIICDDGAAKKDIILNKPSESLLIPPTIWAIQEYQPNTILMVLADKPYDENDYLRNYEEFIRFRK